MADLRNGRMAEWGNGGLAEWRNCGVAEWHNVQYKIVWNQDTESTQMPPWQSPSRLVSLITNQIIKIHEEGRFWTEVMGWRMCVKLWIHFIAGDTSGHNNLVGHMNEGRPKFIYQDYKCLFDDLSSHIPMCSLITSEELKQARLTEDC